MEELQLRPMGIGDILDADFRLYRRNFLTFVGIMAVVQIPIALLNVTAFPGVSANFTASAMEGPTANPAAVIYSGLLVVAAAMIMGSILGPLGTGALTHAVGARFLRRPASIAGSYGAIMPKIFFILVAAFLTTVICAVGYIFCVVPGVILTLKLVLTPVVVVLEDVDPFQALRRSWRLTKGQMGKIFVVLLVVSLIGFVARQVGTTAAYLLPLQESALKTGLRAGLGQLGTLVASPLYGVAVVLLYYDGRIRHEAFDIEVLAKRMEEED